LKLISRRVWKARLRGAGRNSLTMGWKKKKRGRYPEKNTLRMCRVTKSQRVWEAVVNGNRIKKRSRTGAKWRKAGTKEESDEKVVGKGQGRFISRRWRGTDTMQKNIKR